MRSTSSLLACAFLAACSPTYMVQQTSLATLPTAPPPAPLSGLGAIDLGASVATDADPPTVPMTASGLAAPRVQPEGALSVRLGRFLFLRAYAGFALPQGSIQASGTIPGPAELAWTGGIGPVLRLISDDRLVFGDFMITGGFAVVPSRLEVSECDASGCLPPATQIWREVMPVFSVGADLGLRPAEWIHFRMGFALRNQPTNEAIFTRTLSPGSSVSAGPIGAVLRAGFQIDVVDELGLRAEVQWPAVNLALSYGPIFTFAIQGRLGAPTRVEPTGLTP